MITYLVAKLLSKYNTNELFYYVAYNRHLLLHNKIIQPQ